MSRKKSKSKYEPIYDENGHWVQERNRIKGAIRRTFRLFPQMKEVLQEARVELPPLLKKDGTPGKKNQVKYTCAMCKNLFSQKNVQVDHIEPVVPLWKGESDMTYDEIVRGICCNKDNLQVLCSTPIKKNEGKPSCHKIKTDEENFIRKKLQESNEVPKNVSEWTVKIENLKDEYQEHLKQKERERIEKERRKLERQQKRNKKINN
jgi:hypothetical protein